MVFNLFLPPRFTTPTDSIVFDLKILTADNPRPASPDSNVIYLPIKSAEIAKLYVSANRPQGMETGLVWICVGDSSSAMQAADPAMGTGLPLQWDLGISGVYMPGNSEGYFQWEAVSPVFYYDKSAKTWKEIA